ncbi:glycoside hydrolase family 97 protein [Pedobacter borealis]|uniref:glycoside hydrolase family 97 protein n=1 Tax=Pedobacter borealis TaxID=475254 RepID=UPI001AE04936|nr:glycoside hydrolase family 97 protein [Pedobacter borealis]
MLFTKKSFAADGYTVVSPNGKLKLNIRTADSPKAKGELIYDISYKEIPVILNSNMGINGWDSRFTIEKEVKSSKDTVWNPVYGERSEIHDNYNQTIFFVKQEGKSSKLHVIVRAYNEGIAFRYVFAERENATGYGRGGDFMKISADQTTFRVPEKTFCYLTYSAQGVVELMPVKDWKGEAERPLTLKFSNGLYGALGEAALTNFSRTKFRVDKGEENIIRSSMYDTVEEFATLEMPWKVIMVAEKPTDLLANNDIYLNLNPESKIKNTVWIKPGKIIRVGLTTKDAKAAVDFAEKRKLQYIHFDAGWYGAETLKGSDPLDYKHVDPDRSLANDLNLEEVTKYAKSKGIGVWVYVNQRALTDHLDEILPLYKSWGIAGIKFGFVNVGSFRWTTWLHEAVAKCAKYNMMVDIHDEYRPTGFSRTYPNLLTQEGVRGNEEFPDANNNTSLPFTRFLCGPADCTVCYFARKEFRPNATNENRLLKNTPGHQLATSVVFYSPLQFLYWYDSPSDVLDVPELEFFDQLPTVWDDTKVLSGSIGESISIARRSGTKWFVGCMTNNDRRTIDFSFNFLDPSKKYLVTIYSDGGEKVKTATHVKIEKLKISSASKMKLELLARGGCTMIVEEI